MNIRRRIYAAGFAALACFAAPAFASNISSGGGGAVPGSACGDATHAIGWSGSAYTCQAITGSATPGGTSGQVQYNNAGALGGFTLAGDCTLAQPNITCTKTNGVALTTAATTALGTSGATIPLLNAGNTWSGVQSHNAGDLVVNGATSGALTINCAAVCGANTITLPAGTTNFSATGGASQVLEQTSAGGAITVARLACADLSNAASGCSNTSANPSASIGLSAVNGTATTYMTSDSAPALSQAIAPTWTAVHTFKGGVALGSQTGAFGTNGIGVQGAWTQTDSTTAAGTLALAAASAFGATTFATSTNAITITNGINTYFKSPVAGANVTLTNGWALAADTLIVGPSGFSAGTLQIGTNANYITTDGNGFLLHSNYNNRYAMYLRDQWVQDTGISRDAAGIVDFGNGNQSDKTAKLQFTQLNMANANVSAAAWTTTGIAAVENTATYTDTSMAASGTVATSYINRWGIPTIAASNTGITYTNTYGTWFEPPAAGTNVTITNGYAAGFNGSVQLATDGTKIAGSGGAANDYIQLNHNNSIIFAENGAQVAGAIPGGNGGAPGLEIPSADGFTWSSAATVNGTVDTGLMRVAADSVACGNGTASDKSCLFAAQHLNGGGTAPTAAAGTGAGTSPTITLGNATDASFDLILTTGTSPAASATIATVTFNKAYTNAHCTFSPVNATTAALSGTSAPTGQSSASNTTTWVLTSGSAALAASTAYRWSVTCGGP